MGRYSCNSIMSLIGKQAPEFTAQAIMPDGAQKEVKLSDYANKAVVLFFWPFDFTFVCPSEIVAFSRAVKDFNSRGVQVLGCSIDSAFVHAKYRNTPLSEGGIGPVEFPMLADTTHQLAKDYGVYLEAMGTAYRGVFVIDEKHVVRACNIYDLPIGRSTDEILRVVDAMQFTDKHGEVCPANWKKGDKAMKPSQEGVASYMN